MKFVVAKETLLEGVQRIQSIVSPRVTNPIYSNVLITVGDDGVTLVATDNTNIFIRLTVEATVEKTGAITLPAKKLLEIVRSLPSSQVAFESGTDNVASIRCGAAYFKVHGLSAEDFPEIPLVEELSVEEVKEFRIPQRMVKDGLKKTIYAKPDEETRPTLYGVLFSFQDSKLRLVATDGRRLALFEFPFEFPQAYNVDVIVPAKAVSDLSRLLQDTGDVTIVVGANLVEFRIGDTLFLTKRVEGNYPNYRQVLPKEPQARVCLAREELLNVVRRMSVLGEGTDKVGSLQMSLDANTMTISSNAPGVGDAKETVTISYKGPQYSNLFNPDYLMDPLKAIDGDEIYFDIIDSWSPSVVRLKEPMEFSFLYVLMPLRLSRSE